MTEKTVVSADKKIRLNSVTAVENIRLDVDGGKILAASATAYATGFETFSDEFRVTVKTTFNAVLLNADGQYVKKTETVESVRLFSQKGASGTSKAYFCANVKNCSFSENGYELTAEETLSGWYILPEEKALLTPSEDLVCRTEKATVYRTDVVSSAVYLTQSDEMRMPIKAVLDCSATAATTGVFPGEGGFRIEGEATVRIVALSDNDQFLSQTFSHPFDANVVADCGENAALLPECTVIKCDVTLSDGDARTFLVDMELALVTTVNTPAEIEVATDCYSVKYDLTKVEDSLSYNACFCTKTLSDKSSAVLSTGNTVNEIYGCLFPAANDVKVVRDDGLVAEGKISTFVLYADENNAPVCKETSIPFSIRYNGDYPCSSAPVATVQIKSVTARLKTGSDIDVSAEYCVAVRGQEERTLSFLSEVALGAEKEPSDTAICLYLTKPGEDLFDVAKELNCKKEDLLRLNPEITLPLSGGEKILLYNELLLPENK